MTKYSEQIYSRRSRNIIDNSSFNIWQRGVSFTSPGYTADRWIVGSAGSVGWSAGRGAGDDSRISSNYYLTLLITTPDTSITGTDHLHIKQHIEGHNFLPLVGKVGTISFWVFSSLAGTYNLYVRNAADRSYVTEYTINEAYTFEYKTITIPFDYSGGTWNYKNELGLMVGWPLNMGPTYVTSSLNQWVSGVYMGGPTQANFVGDTNLFQITQIQLEVGAIATPYQSLTYKDDLSACQRYYETQYIYQHGVSAQTGTGIIYSNFEYQTQKRTTPTSLTYSLYGDGNDIYQAGSGWHNATSVSIAGSNNKRVYYYMADSANSIYTTGKGNLLRCIFYISADL
jgi:hypothetical protein